MISRQFIAGYVAKNGEKQTVPSSTSSVELKFWNIETNCLSRSTSIAVQTNLIQIQTKTLKKTKTKHHQQKNVLLQKTDKPSQKNSWLNS